MPSELADPGEEDTRVVVAAPANIPQKRARIALRTLIAWTVGSIRVYANMSVFQV
jgi:hypothetical protein